VIVLVSAQGKGSKFPSIVKIKCPGAPQPTDDSEIICQRMVKESGAMFALRVSNNKENRFRIGSLALIAAAWLVGGVSLVSLPAQAAHSDKQDAASTARNGVTALASQDSSLQGLASTDPETTGSIQPKANEDVNCARSRKRLFVKDEGWIVRSVTTCY
jgi:hypothetical protein